MVRDPLARPFGLSLSDGGEPWIAHAAQSHFGPVWFGCIHESCATKDQGKVFNMQWVKPRGYRAVTGRSRFAHSPEFQTAALPRCLFKFTGSLGASHKA